MVNKEKPPELYWSLVIEAGWVQAGIWYIGETAAEVVSIGPGAAWETEEELTGAADAALSSSVQKLPEDYPEPTKTVFGVSSSWVKNGEIEEEYLMKIKKICTELSLTPVGFVVLPEAIAHLYKSEEGSPLSAVIIGLGKEFLEVSVFKLGNLVGTTSVARSVSLIEDVTEGLTRFEGASPLPSRIIVFDGKGGELEEAKEALMQATWEEAGKIKFLHTPKAETLTSDRKVLATSLAGAAEIGHVSQVTSKEAGPQEPLSPEAVQNTSPVKESSAGDMGFAVGKDVSENLQKPMVGSKQGVVSAPRQSVGTKASEYIAKTKTLFHNFAGRFDRGPKISGSDKKKSLLVLLMLVAVGIIGAGILWWFYPKAAVTVYVSPKRFSEEVNVSFSPGGQFDLQKGVIPGTALTDKVSGDKTKATSGSRLIGDKAKGSVQISNGNPSAINLAAGTMLTSSGGLKFVTNTEASVSGQVLPGSPGVAGVDVTAGDIGAQFNLPKGEIFSVGNFSKSLVAATSQSDFSGGSSQQISAVSRDDQTNLETDLKTELKDQAVSNLSSKASPDQLFINDPAGVEVAEENFDHKVGDQAENLKLSLSLNVTGIVADRAKLLEYARGVLKDKIPPGYALRDSQIDFKFAFTGKDGELSDYKVTVGANFLPQADNNAIIGKIAGKTPDVAQNYLTSIPGFSRAEIKLKPRLPAFLRTLPRIPGNITLEILAEQ